MTPKQKLAKIQELVDLQASEDGLWCVSDSATEVYLQDRLRTLHAAIEATDAQGIDSIIEVYRELLL